MIDLTGKVAIVTGAEMTDAQSVGIGGATAQLLAKLGAKVMCASKNGAYAERLADQINSDGGSAIALATDVSVPEQVHAAVEATVQTFGGLEIVHNNAADLELITRDLDVLSTDLDVWEQTLKVNLIGAVQLIKCSLPHMLEGGGGSIINTSSVNGLRGDLTRHAYSASKAALNMLTLSVATAYGKSGIRCNAVCPGLVLTPVAHSMLTEPILDIFLRNHLTPEILGPESIAAVVAFLASDMAAMVTGQVIAVDGGLTSALPFVADFAQLAQLAQE